MSHPLLAPDAAYAADLDAAVQAHRDRVERPPAPDREAPGAAVPVVVCLLDDLESGRTVEAERLRWEDQDEVYDLQVLGFPVANLRFRLRLQNSVPPAPGPGNESLEEDADATSDVITLNDDLRAVTEALTADRIWREQLRSVTIGQHDRGVMRWRIALARRTDGAAHQIRMLPAPGGTHPGSPTESWWQIQPRTVLQLQPAQYVGTGRVIQVHSPVPLSDPSPARRGAIAVCLPLPRGWGLVSLEPRRFRASWPLVEPPIEEYGY